MPIKKINLIGATAIAAHTSAIAMHKSPHWFYSECPREHIKQFGQARLCFIGLRVTINQNIII